MKNHSTSVGRPPRRASAAFSLLFAIASSGVAAQDAPSPRALAAFLPEEARFHAVETTIPMRDGQALAADVYLPKQEGRYPTVLVQTPYDKSLMRPAFVGEGRWGADSLFTNDH
jgi:hypothetical protein